MNTHQTFKIELNKSLHVDFLCPIYLVQEIHKSLSIIFLEKGKISSIISKMSAALITISLEGMFCYIIILFQKLYVHI